MSEYPPAPVKKESPDSNMQFPPSVAGYPVAGINYRQPYGSKAYENSLPAPPYTLGPQPATYSGPDAENKQPSAKRPKHRSKTTRKKHKNSHLGCATCKLRRIKCDETLPECKNCLRAKLRCAYLTLDDASRNALKSAQLAQRAKFENNKDGALTAAYNEGSVKFMESDTASSSTSLSGMPSKAEEHSVKPRVVFPSELAAVYPVSGPVLPQPYQTLSGVAAAAAAAAGPTPLAFHGHYGYERLPPIAAPLGLHLGPSAAGGGPSAGVGPSVGPTVFKLLGNPEAFKYKYNNATSIALKDHLNTAFDSDDSFHSYMAYASATFSTRPCNLAAFYRIRDHSLLRTIEAIRDAAEMRHWPLHVTEDYYRYIIGFGFKLFCFSPINDSIFKCQMGREYAAEATSIYMESLEDYSTRVHVKTYDSDFQPPQNVETLNRMIRMHFQVFFEIVKMSFWPHYRPGFLEEVLAVFRRFKLVVGARHLDVRTRRLIGHLERFLESFLEYVKKPQGNRFKLIFMLLTHWFRIAPLYYEAILQDPVKLTLYVFYQMVAKALNAIFPDSLIYFFTSFEGLYPIHPKERDVFDLHWFDKMATTAEGEQLTFVEEQKEITAYCIKVLEFFEKREQTLHKFLTKNSIILQYINEDYIAADNLLHQPTDDSDNTNSPHAISNQQFESLVAAKLMKLKNPGKKHVNFEIKESPVYQFAPLSNTDAYLPTFDYKSSRVDDNNFNLYQLISLFRKFRLTRRFIIEGLASDLSFDFYQFQLGSRLREAIYGTEHDEMPL